MNNVFIILILLLVVYLLEFILLLILLKLFIIIVNVVWEKNENYWVKVGWIWCLIYVCYRKKNVIFLF